MQFIGKIFIVAGIIFFTIGLLFVFVKKLPVNLGKLPGDIKIKKENFSFYFPITTSILVSIILSIVLTLIFRYFTPSIFEFVKKNERNSFNINMLTNSKIDKPNTFRYK